MIRLAVADLRDSWVAWLGVSLAFVVTNAGLALAAVILATSYSPAAEAALDADGTSLLAAYGTTNLLLVGLVGLAVIGASTSLVVTSRRGAVARLLLGGATPGQVTRLLTIQVAVVTLVTAVVGDVIAVAAAQPVLDAIARDRGLAHVDAAVTLGLLLTTNLLCAALATLGALRQARAASRIPPVEALREATSGTVKRESAIRMTLRGVRFLACAGLVVVAFPGFRTMAPELGDDAAPQLMQVALLLIPLTGLALTAILPWICRGLTRAWTAAVPMRTPAWRLARETVIAKADRLVRSIVPVMFSVGLFFGLMAIGDTFVATAHLLGVDDLEGTSTTTLITFIGLALAVAVAGSVGNLVMMSRQRGAELALAGIVGATPRQQVLVPALEAVIVTVTASLLGLLMAAVGGGFIAYGLGIVLPAAQLSIPWGVFVGTVAVCLVAVVAATVLPVLASLRRPAPAVIARLVAS